MRNLEDEEKGRKFVIECEGKYKKNPTNIWEEVEKIFQPSDFPYYKRGHKKLNWAAWVMCIGFVFVAFYVIMELIKCGK